MFSSQRLKLLRKEKGLTQEQLGKLLNLTKVSICGYEKGKRVPDLDTFQDIIKIFNVSADYLLGNDLSGNIVKDKEEKYIVSLSQEDWEFINELKKHPDLYREVMSSDKKRIIELLNKLLK